MFCSLIGKYVINIESGHNKQLLPLPRNRTRVLWNIKDKNGKMNKEYINNLWNYIYDKRITFEFFKNLYIIPCVNLKNETVLCQCDTQSFVLSQLKESNDNDNDNEQKQKDSEVTTNVNKENSSNNNDDKVDLSLIYELLINYGKSINQSAHTKLDIIISQVIIIVATIKVQNCWN